MIEQWKIACTIPAQNVEAMKIFYNEHRSSPMVVRRLRRNIDQDGLDFSRDFFLRAILLCLCSSRQPSGPESRMADFMRTTGRSIDLKFCEEQGTNLRETLALMLQTAGLRLSSNIAGYFGACYQHLENSSWQLLSKIEAGFSGTDRRNWEIDLADKLRSNGSVFRLPGLGLKQSRNLLQILGVTRYEISRACRFCTWLNRYGFPYQLSAADLQSEILYSIIMDSVVDLCNRIDVHPCLLDAAVFSSLDDGGWNEENLVF